MDESFHIADLIVKNIQGAITPGEQQELDRWIREDPHNQAIYDRACDPGKQLEKLEIYHLFDKEKVWANLEEELFKTKTVRFTPRKYLRYAAAILLPLMITGGFTWWYIGTSSRVTLAQIDSEIKPGSQKAILILSDGEMVELGQEASTGTLYDGEVSITDADKQISYNPGTRLSPLATTIFNELRTPRGGGYNLQLADGTRVWLNSGSSLKYPVSFQDSVRQVLLEGEAYFEVSHSNTPFIVSSGNMSTRVLGTSFNISAYSDDTAFKTTLIEGKVHVELSDQNAFQSPGTILEPNEQATFVPSTGEIAKAEVTASEYTSWMRGKLEFHNETLEEVMKRLARWYDFNYTFENAAARDLHFSARLDRDENISVVLEMLEMTTDVRFEFKDRSILVL